MFELIVVSSLQKVMADTNYSSENMKQDLKTKNLDR